MRNLILFLLVALLCYTSANLISDTQEYFPEHLQLSDHFIFDESEDQVNDINVKVDIDNVQYYLFTRQNPFTPFQITNANLSLLNDSNFDPEKEILIVVHGWRGSVNYDMMKLVRETTIEAYDINIIIIDWSKLAKRIYINAKNSVVGVGEIVGDFITELELTYNINPSNIILAGHSLGAHIMGVAGARIQENNQTVEYIVGLDPAAPLYDLTATGNRLDSTDANFVQVIHTSSNFFGIESPIGHSDYYPNGGFQQPGCELDISGFCAHERVVVYYAESIGQGSVFIGKKCLDYNTYKTGTCDTNSQSPMGQLHIDTTANGVYYLITNSNSPYGQS